MGTEKSCGWLQPVGLGAGIERRFTTSVTSFDHHGGDAVSIAKLDAAFPEAWRMGRR